MECIESSQTLVSKEKTGKPFETPSLSNNVLLPFLDGRQVLYLFRVQKGFHDTAIGMAADNDVRDFQYRHRVLDGRGTAALHGPIGRDQVSGISQNEQLARLGLGHECRIDARVRTGDEEGSGFLFLRETCKTIFPFSRRPRPGISEIP